METTTCPPDTTQNVRLIGAAPNRTIQKQVMQ